MKKQKIFIVIVILSGLFLSNCAAPATLQPSPTMGATELVKIELVEEATLTVSPTAAVAAPPQEPATPTIEVGEGLPPLPPGQELIISEIDMFTAEQGWAVGGLRDPGDRVLRTADGGQTWIEVTPPEPPPEDDTIYKAAFAFFLDLEHAWVLYYFQNTWSIPSPALVWHTSDGGQSWALSPLPYKGGAEFFHPSRFFFADTEHGWLTVSVGAGMSHNYTVLQRTTDGGLTWEVLLDPYGANELQICSKTSMKFTDAENGWITRDCMGLMEGGEVLKTDDGGLTWTSIDLPPPGENPDALSYPSYCESHSLYLFDQGSLVFKLDCRSYDENNQLLEYFFIYSSDNGGIDWDIHEAPAGKLAMFSTDSGFSLSREIQFTKNGGLDWQLIKQVNWEGDFDWVSEQLGWAVARDGDEIALVFSDDGGLTWHLIEPVVGE